MGRRRFGAVAFVLALAAVAPAMAFGGKGGGMGMGRGGMGAAPDRVPEYFAGYDLNGDGALSRAEWKRRGNFERLDRNGDGILDLSEFRVIFEAWGRLGDLAAPILPSSSPEMDPTVEADRVPVAAVGKHAVCAFTRLRRCPDGDAAAAALGLAETGLGPVFPAHALCHGIDETYAMNYEHKTGRGHHGGIDLPTDVGTPILAAADGTVVGVFEGDNNARGRTIVLRHSPEDTGLPFWLWTEYAHLDALPTQTVGQRVRMGEVLGPTGNSGINPGARDKRSGNLRRPALHFAVYASDGRRFAEVPNYVVPLDGWWMDPVALYRGRPPFDTPSMIALPEAEKAVPVPVMFLDGAVEPAASRLLWPYACARD